MLVLLNILKLPFNGQNKFLNRSMLDVRNLTSSVHTVNNFHSFVIIKHVFVFEDHMLDWHSCQICYPLEINIIIIII